MRDRLDYAREQAVAEGLRLSEELRQARDECDAGERERADESVKGRRTAEELERAREELRAVHIEARRALDKITDQSTAMDAAREERRRLTEAVDQLQSMVESLTDSLSSMGRHRDSFVHELEEMRSSRTWRWTRPFRVVYERLFKW